VFRARSGPVFRGKLNWPVNLELVSAIVDEHVVMLEEGAPYSPSEEMSRAFPTPRRHRGVLARVEGMLDRLTLGRNPRPAQKMWHQTGKLQSCFVSSPRAGDETKRNETKVRCLRLREQRSGCPFLWNPGRRFADPAHAQRTEDTDRHA
jgi:hypothetical protein